MVTPHRNLSLATFVYPRHSQKTGSLQKTYRRDRTPKHRGCLYRQAREELLSPSLFPLTLCCIPISLLTRPRRKMGLLGAAERALGRQTAREGTVSEFSGTPKSRLLCLELLILSSHSPRKADEGPVEGLTNKQCWDVNPKVCLS